MMKKKRNKVDLKSKIFKNIYLKNSNDIYVRNHRKMKKIERPKTRCQDAFLCFLQKNLSTVNFARAFKYVNDLSEKSNNITAIWNQIFYCAGLENKEKFRLMEKNDTEYRELAKVLLIFIIKERKNLNDFVEQINDMECMFELIVGIRTDVIPINNISKILQLDVNSGEDEEFADKIRDIIQYEKNDEHIEEFVEELLKEYGF